MTDTGTYTGTLTNVAVSRPPRGVQGPVVTTADLVSDNTEIEVVFSRPQCPPSEPSSSRGAPATVTGFHLSPARTTIEATAAAVGPINWVASLEARQSAAETARRVDGTATR